MIEAPTISPENNFFRFMIVISSKLSVWQESCRTSISGKPAPEPKISSVFLKHDTCPHVVGFNLSLKNRVLGGRKIPRKDFLKKVYSFLTVASKP
ncbi:hypothetical protein BKP64_04425 [Marinobacter salinus]|uniref:Uncharacterized protein n=1 Tax=Marinobacter salinus TaxID=1874317 RepID=A0A1D9GIX8_9GAMM|nr:hypothetical protein BKP64_04425 [Marinobacter salinus]